MDLFIFGYHLRVLNGREKGSMSDPALLQGIELDRTSCILKKLKPKFLCTVDSVDIGKAIPLQGTRIFTVEMA